MKHTILFVAANPRDTLELALKQECAEIEQELRLTSGHDDFDVQARWAVSVDDLMRYLNELSPAVLHFSGHGTGRASSASGVAHRDVELIRSGAGILLEDRDRTQYVSEHALAQMIASASPRTRLVVLNACHSDTVAASLSKVVDCVIGIAGAIEDGAARSFAVGFYRALGYRHSIGIAVKQAAATLDAKQQPGEIVKCHPRDGIDANQMMLSAGMPLTKRMGPYDLFLAHPPANKASAVALYDLLQPHFRVFLASHSLSPGDRWDQALATAQRTSRATVLLISSQATSAWYLGDEVLAAIALHQASPAEHRIVPVLLESGIVLPRCLAGIDAIDAGAVGFPAGVAARLRAQALHRDAAPRSPPLDPTSDHRAGGAHFRLYDRLGQLTDSVFEQVLARARVDLGSIAPRSAALAERGLDVAQLAALDPELCRRVSLELDRLPWTRR